MEKIRRLRQKKGFTIIELIVVIAIIGILIALVLPAMSPGDKASAGKGYAKDFFYKSQSFMSRKKLASDKAISDITIFYFNVTPNGLAKTGTDILVPDPSSYGTASKGGTQTNCSSLSGAMKTFATSFAREVDKTLTSPAYDGTLYVVVDGNYRVQVAYWTDAGWGDIKDGPTFTDDCKLDNGYVSCAFPTRLSRPEGGTQTMFTY